MSANYNLIPVTRASTTTRAHADVTYGFNKHGDLTIILSPSFLATHPALPVGGKVLMGFNPETKGLLIAPPTADVTTGLRTIRPRAGFAGAGTVFAAAQNLPEGLPKVSKRGAVRWADEVDNGAGGVVLHLAELQGA